MAGMKLGPQAPRLAAIVCDRCRDFGVIFLGITPPAGWGSGATVRKLLEAEQACLCRCEAGQWWAGWLADLFGDRAPTTGVPEGLLTGPEAVRWIERRAGL